MPLQKTIVVHLTRVPLQGQLIKLNTLIFCQNTSSGKIRVSIIPRCLFVPDSNLGGGSRNTKPDGACFNI